MCVQCMANLIIKKKIVMYINWLCKLEKILKYYDTITHVFCNGFPLKEEERDVELVRDT